MVEAWARRFWQARMQREGHGLREFYVLGPKLSLVQTLLTGFVKDRFYMAGDEVIAMSFDVHRDALLRDPGFHVDAVSYARDKANIKDQVVIGLASRSYLNAVNRLEDRRAYRDRELEVMKALPPNLLHRYLELMRKAGRHVVGKGLGSYEKGLLEDALLSWSPERAEYYAMRYRRDLADIVRVVHPRAEGELKRILGWAVARPRGRTPPTDRLRAYEEALKALDAKDYVRALALIADYRLPFELVRARIDREEFRRQAEENPWLRSDAARAIKEAATASAAVLNARSIAEMLGDEEAAEAVRGKLDRGRVSCFDLMRAAVAVRDRFPATYRELNEAMLRKAGEVREELLIPGLKEPKVVVCLDASGSMFSSPRGRPTFRDLEFNALCMSIPLYLSGLARATVAFSEDARPEPLRVECPRDAYSAYLSLRESYGGGTDVGRGVRAALEEALREGAEAIVLFTDEQENVASGRAAAEEVEEAVRRGVSVVVVNPSPYPAHSVPTAPGVYHLPAATPEAMVAAARIVQAHRLNEEEASELIAPR